MDILSDKKKLRGIMLARRKNLAIETKTRLDCSITANLVAMPKFKEAVNIFLFHSLSDEPDTSRIMKACLDSGKKIALPRITDIKNRKMAFYFCPSAENLQAGPFGLLEPDLSCAQAAIIPDLIIMPGLAFDKKGNRLGYGQGFYDRFLARLQPEKSLLLGLAYSFQIIEKAPVEKTDFPVNGICTEKELIWA